MTVLGGINFKTAATLQPPEGSEKTTAGETAKKLGATPAYTTTYAAATKL
jgi:hypothetical protein